MTHFFARSRSVRTFGITFVASLAALFSASPVDARITRIEIDAARSQSPTFGGFSWPNVGQYEKIVARRSRGQHHGKLRSALEKMVSDRLLLCEDAGRKRRG